MAESEHRAGHEWNWSLESKHNIFMTHSGPQKDFTHQLSLDLQRDGHFPFFDQWSDCLLKGDGFAELILEAAKQCNMAVVVLSPEYMKSKWAMIELNAFYMAQSLTRPELILFPAFYKLEPGDLSDESKLQAWEEEWKKHEEKDVSGRIDIKSWRRAVEKLRGINGLRFSGFRNSEVLYRARLVEEVCNRLPPCLGYDLSGIRGCDQLCEILEGMFEPTTNGNAQGVQILGLYGMGGTGKTITCKALCNHFQYRFQGRVCHVELGADEKYLDLQKKVLKKLTNLGDSALQGISDSRQAQLQMERRMGGQDVFLAIDNVEDGHTSREQARAFCNIRTFNARSMLMVTGRSSIVVRDVVGQARGIYCKPVPSVDATEALSIFLDKAAPGKSISSLSTKERDVVEECVKPACFLAKYNPLALRELASYYNDVDAQSPLSWQDHLNNINKFRPSQESKSGTMFQILGLGFDKFSKPTQLLFLDVALLISNLNSQLNFLPSTIPAIQWLSAMHREKPPTIRLKLKELERLTYLEECGQDFEHITVHNLYWEFARWYVAQSCEEDANSATWIYYGRGYTRVPTLLEKRRVGKFWKALSRIYVFDLSKVNILPRQSQAWVNVVVLHLEYCTDLASLDLEGMDCLQHLAVLRCRRLKKVEVSVEEECLPRLQYFILKCNYALESVPEIWRCTELVSVEVRYCPKLLLPTMDIQAHCPKLECLEISGLHETVHLFDSLTQSNLQILDIESVQESALNDASSFEFELDVNEDPNEDHPTDEQGRLQSHVVQYGTNLRTLHLSLLSLKNSQTLEMLTGLEQLTLTNVQLVDEAILRLEGLTHLRNLTVVGGNVHTIIGIEELSTLETLRLQDMKSLQHLPNLEKLTRLRGLEVIGCGHH